MELIEFIKTLTPEGLEAFAVQVGTTVAHLRNVAYKQRVASAALAAQIQVHSKGLVQVSTLRPKDWQRVWGAEVNQTLRISGIVSEPNGVASVNVGAPSAAGLHDGRDGGQAVAAA